ncbi:heparanase-like [Patella vulgata]|uniref:heparanase-like n=1 Tax=Patella vulgata TaxID=6465 RepID=UPI0024A94344|nr:heparanase-like [Patella vulgata]
MDSGGIKHHWNNYSFTSPKLLTLARGLTPCIIRVGGTDADYVIFTRNNTEQSSSKQNYGDHYNFTMSAGDWDKINIFANSTGWDLIFDLNIAPRVNGQWDTTNAMELLKYTAEKGYKLYGFELGNELNISPQFHVNAQQSAVDFLSLRKILKSIPSLSSSLVIGPDVAGLVVSFTDEFLEAGGVIAVDVVTFHHYYMGGSAATVDKFKDPSILDSLAPQIIESVAAIGKTAPGKPVWLGETSTTWSAGPDNIGSAYVASFMWLDKLGVCARYGVKGVLRQTFSGNGALLGPSDFDPNTDYWISVLYKRLVGGNVFNVTQSSDRNIRMYAHCTKIPSTMGYERGSVTVYILNLGSDAVTLDITV